MPIPLQSKGLFEEKDDPPMIRASFLRSVETGRAGDRSPCSNLVRRVSGVCFSG